MKHKLALSEMPAITPDQHLCFARKSDEQLLLGGNPGTRMSVINRSQFKTSQVEYCMIMYLETIASM